MGKRRCRENVPRKVFVTWTGKLIFHNLISKSLGDNFKFPQNKKGEFFNALRKITKYIKKRIKNSKNCANGFN